MNSLSLSNPSFKLEEIFPEAAGWKKKSNGSYEIGQLKAKDVALRILLKGRLESVNQHYFPADEGVASFKNGPIIIDQKTIKFIVDLAEGFGLTALPNPLFPLIAQLPKRYKSLHLISLMTYLSNKVIGELLTKNQSKTDLITNYLNIGVFLLFLSLPKTSLQSAILPVLKKIIEMSEKELPSQAGNCINRIVVEFSNVIMRLSGNRAEDSELKKQTQSWNLGFYFFESSRLGSLSKTISLQDTRSIAEYKDQLDFFDCIRPGFLKDFGALIPHIQSFALNLVELTSKRIEDCIGASINELSCTFVVPDFSAYLSNKIDQAFNKLILLYKVDVLDNLTPFSIFRGSRLQREGTDEELHEFHHSYIEESQQLLKNVMQYHEALRNFIIDVSDDLFLIEKYIKWIVIHRNHPDMLKNSWEKFSSEYPEMSALNMFIKEMKKETDNEVEADNNIFQNLQESIKSLRIVYISFFFHFKSIIGFVQDANNQADLAITKAADMQEKEAVANRHFHELLNEPEKREKKRKGKRKTEKKTVRSISHSGPPSSIQEISRPAHILPIEKPVQAPLTKEHLLHQLFETFYSVTMINPFAKMSWNSAKEQFKDLMAELWDEPDPSNPEHVAGYVNRMITVLSLLMEQFLSAHLLEQENVADKYQRWSVLQHSSEEMLDRINHLKEIPQLRERVNEISGLEIYARNLHTEPAKESLGALLIQRAENLRTSSTPSSVNAILQETRELTISHLQMFDLYITNQNRDLSLLTETFIDLPILIPETELCELIDQITPRMACLSANNLVSGYLKNGERLLRLLHIRFSRGLSRGNIRNYFKDIVTLLPFAIENICKAIAQQRDLIDCTNKLSHNLFDWLELIEVIQYSPEEYQYLVGTTKINNLARYTQLYNDLPLGSKRIKMHQQLTQINKQTFVGNWSLAPSTDRKIQQAIDDLHKESAVGLKLCLRLLAELMDQSH